MDTEKRQNLTPKVNAFFAVKRSFPNDKKNIKKGLLAIFGEESFLVDYTIQISNLDLVKDLAEVVHFLTTLQLTVW